MRIGWLITICLLIIGAVSLFLWYIEPQGKLSNIVQADAIIALVFVTIFYAIQTKKLVKKQEESIKEERKRRDAEYADNKLQEFFSPVIINLSSLIVNLKKLKSLVELKEFVAGMDRTIDKVIRLMEKYFYLLPEEHIIGFGRVVEIHKKALLLKDDKELKNWKEDSISAIEDFIPGLQRLNATFLIKVSEAFGVHDKKTIEKLRSRLIKMAKNKNQ